MKKIKLLITCLLFTSIINAQVGINTENPQSTLHVQGDMIIADTPPLTNATILVVDNDGHVGTAAYVPAKLFLIQSGTNQLYAPNGGVADTFNQAEPIIVAWAQSDVKSNNIMVLNNDNTFTFEEAGTYELSGYINYRVGSAIAATLADITSIAKNLATLNVVIQLYNANTSSWTSLAGSRYLISGPGIDRYVETVHIPPVLYKFAAGDKIRMIFFRPTPSSGMLHGTTSEFGIIKPDGMEFTKGMKVIAY